MKSTKSMADCALNLATTWAVTLRLRGDTEFLEEIIESSLRDAFLKECKRRSTDKDYDKDTQNLYRGVAKEYKEG